MSTKIGILDIEVAPNVAQVWSLFKTNVGINQILSDGYVISYAFKVYGKDKIYYEDLREGYKSEADLLRSLAKLLSTVDAVVAHNGDRFDIPWIKGRMAIHDIPLPPPIKQVDTLKIAKREFRFNSNRLDNLCRLFNIEGKLKERKFIGHDLWTETCFNDNIKAWEEMRAYNIQDVHSLEGLFVKLIPYVRNFSPGLYNDKEEHSCPSCGSHKVQRRGHAYTAVGRYQRYHCQSCGKWSRDGDNLLTKEKRKKVLRNVV